MMYLLSCKLLPRLLVSAAVFVFSVQVALALDLDSDGRGEVALFSEGKFTLRTPFGLISERGCGGVGEIPITGKFTSATADGVGTFNPSLGRWTLCLTTGSVQFVWGVPGDRPVTCDFDGDGLSDFGVYRPASSEWLVAKNLGGSLGPSLQTTGFGKRGSQPVPADYDGDGICDLAVIHNEAGSGEIVWEVEGSASGLQSTTFGSAGDIPVPADYNGDGSTDLAIFQPRTGSWRQLLGSEQVTTFGLPGDVPAPEDLDGDGRADLVVYRPVTARFLARGSQGLDFELSLGSGRERVAHNSITTLFDPRPAGDFNGNRRTDLAIARVRSTNKLELIFSALEGEVETVPKLELGNGGDEILPGDFDGDGVTDLVAVRTVKDTLKWQIQLLGNRASRALGRFDITLGLVGDAVFTGDFDGDLKSDFAVTHLDGEAGWAWFIQPVSALSGPVKFHWGTSGDRFLIGDIDGDNRDDIVAVGVVGDALQWNVRAADGSFQTPVTFGIPRDTPFLTETDGTPGREFGVVRIVDGKQLVITEGETPYFWGLERDTGLSGDFDGTGFSRRAFYFLLGSQGYFALRGADGEPTVNAFGVKGDVPISPNGVTRTFPFGTAATNGRLQCVVTRDIGREQRGFRWRPRSPKNGKLLVQFSGSLKKRIKNVALVESGIQGDRVIETLRFSGNQNGKPTFRGALPGKEYPTGVFLVRQDQKNRQVCIRVAEPAQPVAK